MPIPGTFPERLALFQQEFCCQSEDATTRLSDSNQVRIDKIMSFMTDCFYPEELRLPQVQNMVWNTACQRILQKQ